MRKQFWERSVYFVILAGCGVFILLTFIAMLFYPGGSYSDPATTGYSFFENFFSELGLARTHLGGPKIVSLVLFVSAMVLVGIGLILFFIAFPRRFRRTRTGRLLGMIGSAFGFLSALAFIAVAVFPADVNLPAHTTAVMWAFRLFPAAVMCYIIVVFTERGMCSPWGWALVAFLLLLVVYLLLLERGPGIGEYAGMVIQAVGQKIIVYASIFSVMLQSWGALRARE